MFYSQSALIDEALDIAEIPDAVWREDMALLATGDPGGILSRWRDRALAYIEAIYWQKLATGQLQASAASSQIFPKPGVWARKCEERRHAMVELQELMAMPTDEGGNPITSKVANEFPAGPKTA